jgi:hypothetical protein
LVEWKHCRCSSFAHCSQRSYYGQWRSSLGSNRHSTRFILPIAPGLHADKKNRIFLSIRHLRNLTVAVLQSKSPSRFALLQRFFCCSDYVIVRGNIERCQYSKFRGKLGKDMLKGGVGERGQGKREGMSLNWGLSLGDIGMSQRVSTQTFRRVQAGIIVLKGQLHVSIFNTSGLSLINL